MRRNPGSENFFGHGPPIGCGLRSEEKEARNFVRVQSLSSTVFVGSGSYPIGASTVPPIHWPSWATRPPTGPGVSAGE